MNKGRGGYGLSLRGLWRQLRTFK